MDTPSLHTISKVCGKNPVIFTLTSLICYLLTAQRYINTTLFLLPCPLKFVGSTVKNS